MAVHNMIIQIPFDSPKDTCWGFSVFVQWLAPNTTAFDLIELGSCVGPVVEVRLFNRKENAHIRFTKVEHAIKFMEMTNYHPFPMGIDDKHFRLLMSPDADYPCLAVSGFPKGTTRYALRSSLQRQVPNIRIVEVRYLDGQYAVIEYENQRLAKKMRKLSEEVPIIVGQNRVTFQLEGIPCIRINNLTNFTDKDQIMEAFNVDGRGHVFAVAILSNRAFVYFDYRFNAEHAFESIPRPFKLRMPDGQTKKFIISLI